ncbi:MAG: Elongation factor P [Candidatus Moranbacteria bacterium GW2011_GWE1_49_15]|nr:MAG: Elongation factor P [Candidatus Moranbacteria bacterium GW2011_GWE2_47_10]KKW06810.1 MAG: Elongation factor P [Candidatus Moranbacteria bacterium GW2011_GWE1_49_15]HBP00979.1 elongation factor P [Candidatus Moranbacteria bacterium]
MLNINEIKNGKNILWNEEPFVVLSAQHSKTGRAGAVLRTKLKNLITGAMIDKTFQGADKVEEADISKSKAQYLYKEGDAYNFMDNSSYDQFSLSHDVIGDLALWMIEGTEVTVSNFNSNPVNIELPVKVTLTVTDAPPGIKGDTASSGDKLVTLETGAKVTTPLFVETGDKIIVNTETGTYVSRA